MITHVHVFYHADRSGTLSEGQHVQLDDGLSVFGKCYWQAIQTTDPGTLTNEQRREYELEKLRIAPPFNCFVHSRLTAMFAALTVDDAVRFANDINPRPEGEIPIFEVWSNNFATRDSNWLDFQAQWDRQREEYYKSYWSGEVTNHRPAAPPRRPPRLEVVVQLPAVIGKRVATVPALQPAPCRLPPPTASTVLASGLPGTPEKVTD